jgi:predicted Zn-dependent protease
MLKALKALDYPDLLYLEAAKGWVILGDLKEANRELDHITTQMQKHADVLEVRFAIFSKAKKWIVCMELAAAMLDLAPDRPTAWINSAQTLHEMEQTEDAWNALYAVRHKFPKVPAIPYNLACYAAKLGRLDDSQKWLRKAFALGGKQFKRMALIESDLKPLWEKIKQL